MWHAFALILLLAPQDGKFIERVRTGTLDFNTLGTVGLVTDYYRYFETRSWVEKDGPEGLKLVVFEGVMDDAKAVDDFHEKYRHTLHMGLKSMQLASYYNLTKDKQKLRFRVVFAFEQDLSFKVVSGTLGVLSLKGEWSDRPLTDKSLVAILDAIYTGENPYAGLVKGLPLK